jgi:hypothetical protein
MARGQKRGAFGRWPRAHRDRETAEKAVYAISTSTTATEGACLLFAMHHGDINVLSTQIDLQLESGEYFLKPTERKRREERERKQKVCVSQIESSLWNPPVTFIYTAN